MCYLSNGLEAVSALLNATRLNTLTTNEPVPLAHVSSPRIPTYGTSLFEVSFDNSAAPATPSPAIVWSGETPFHEIVIDRRPSASKRVKQKLIADSRRFLSVGSLLDLRNYKPVGRRLGITGPVNVRDYGRIAIAPDLAFVDVTWRIKNLPRILATGSQEQWFPLMRVAYVFNTRTSKVIFRDTHNFSGLLDRKKRFLKEPNGPLLMATTIDCYDGEEPILLDVEHETFGTMRRSDVPEITHCFPGL